MNQNKLEVAAGALAGAPAKVAGVAAFAAIVGGVVGGVKHLFEGTWHNPEDDFETIKIAGSEAEELYREKCHEAFIKCIESDEVTLNDCTNELKTCLQSFQDVNVDGS